MPSAFWRLLFSFPALSLSSNTSGLSLPCDLATALGAPYHGSKLRLQVTPRRLRSYAIHLAPCHDDGAVDDGAAAVSLASKLPPPVAKLDWLECTNEPDMPLPGNEGINVSWELFADLSGKYLECRQFYNSRRCDHMGLVLGIADAVMWNDAAPDALEWQVKFSKVVKGEEKPETMEGLCYFGKVAALFVRSVHLAPTQPAAARGLVKIALDLLGGDILSLDFLESTERWRWIHGAVVEQALVWMEWERKRPGMFGPDGFMVTGLFTTNRDPPHPALGLSEESPRAERFGRKQASADLFIAHSFHFGYMLQISSLLFAALPLVMDGTARVKLLASPTGLGGKNGGAPWNTVLTCQYLGVCDASDACPEVDQLSRALDKLHDVDPSEAYLEGIRAVIALGRRFPALSESIVVGGDTLQVLLMSQAFPKARFLVWMALTPFITRNIELLGKPLLTTEVLHIMSFKELARNTAKVSLLVDAESIAEDLQYLVAIPSEVVFPPSLFMVEYRRPALQPDVLLHGRLWLRKSLWPCVLPHFAPGWNFVRLDKEIISFERMGEFFACIFFAHNLELLGIMDLYAVGVPMLVPSWQLMLKTERLISLPGRRNTWAESEAFHPSLTAGSHFAHPFPPFWDGAEHPGRVPPAQFGYWWQFSYFAVLPHIIKFESMPELAAQLHSLDRPSVSRQMRRAHVRLAESSVHRFAKALAALV